MKLARVQAIAGDLLRGDQIGLYLLLNLVVGMLQRPRNEELGTLSGRSLESVVGVNAARVLLSATGWLGGAFFLRPPSCCPYVVGSQQVRGVAGTCFTRRDAPRIVPPPMILAGALDISISLLLVAHVVVSLLLILVVLMQRPKQEGLGAAFGAGMTDQMFGAQTTNVLQKGTAYFGTAFLVLSLVLAILIGKRNFEKGIDETPPPVTIADLAPPIVSPSGIDLDALKKELEGVTPPFPVPAPNTTPETAPNTTPETAPNTTPETTPEPAPETAPEPTPEATPKPTPAE